MIMRAKKLPPSHNGDSESKSLIPLRGQPYPAPILDRCNTGTALGLLHRGEHPEAIASLLQVSLQTVFNVKRRYLTGGLEATLFDQTRSGRPIRIDGTQRAKTTALACSTLPEGHARWSLQLLADKAVELEYTTPSKRSSKKRVKAASEKDVVHRRDQCRLFSTDETPLVALLFTTRCSFSDGLFRRTPLFLNRPYPLCARPQSWEH